jgi:hypothetical protein
MHVSVMHNKNRLNNILIAAKPPHPNPILQFTTDDITCEKGSLISNIISLGCET